jgi:hypothetical protein
MPFRKGVSGNPAGMKPGTQHKLTLEMRKIASKNGPAVFRDIAKRAKLGDPFCQRLFMHYFAPRSKLNPATFELPKPTTASEAAGHAAEITAMIAKGEIDYDAAQATLSGLQTFIAAVNVVELERRAEAGLQDIATLKAELDEMRRNPR